MSLFDALNTAVAGLSAQEGAMGNISDNIANAQTIGYKAIGTEFDSLVEYNGAFQEPGSVSIHSVYYTDVAGTLTSSQESTSLAVNGNGFFIVKGAPTTASTAGDTFNSSDYYTRRGDFTVNADGYLVNGAGYFLEGYPVNSATGLTSSSTLQALQIPQGISAPNPTSEITLAGDLPSITTPPASGYITQAPVTTTVYDGLGNPQTVTTQFQETAGGGTIKVGGTSTTESGTVYTAQITSGSPPTTTTLRLEFSNGPGGGSPPNSQPYGTLEAVYKQTNPLGSAPPTCTLIAGATSGGVGGQAANVGLSFKYNGVNQNISLKLGNIGVATNGLNAYAPSDGSPAIDITTNSQDGYGQGQVAGVSIDGNGYLNLSFSNGQTQKVAQLALAQFAATNQLQSLDGSTFGATEASGPANVNLPGQNGNGAIAPGELEQSNVSLSSQLTSLITAQQVYTSNARVISTADQMLQTLTQTIQG